MNNNLDFIKELEKIEVKYNNSLGIQDTILTLNSYIKKVDSDHILIDFLTNKGLEYHIFEGEKLEINFKVENGYYTGLCEVIGIDEFELPGIKVSYPDEVKYIQRRDYPRVSLKLHIELLAHIKELKRTIAHNIKTLDISGSGFCFISDKPFDGFSDFLGYFHLPSHKAQPVKIKLKHVYSREIIICEKEKYKIAFTYPEISEDDREKLLREIFLYQLKVRKKGLSTF